MKEPEGSILQVSAAVLSLEDGRILLARRAPGRSQEGLWEFPGGKLESGESPAGSLVRELREELCLEVEVLAPVATAEGRLPSGRTLRLLAYRVRPLPPVPAWACSGLALDARQTAEQGFPDHDGVAWPRPERLLDYPMPEVDVSVALALQASQ